MSKGVILYQSIAKITPRFGDPLDTASTRLVRAVEQILQVLSSTDKVHWTHPLFTSFSWGASVCSGELSASGYNNSDRWHEFAAFDVKANYDENPGKINHNSWSFTKPGLRGVLALWLYTLASWKVTASRRWLSRAGQGHMRIVASYRDIQSSAIRLWFAERSPIYIFNHLYGSYQDLYAYLNQYLHGRPPPSVATATFDPIFGLYVSSVAR